MTLNNSIPVWKKGEVSTRFWFYSLNVSIQKLFIHPSWCLIARQLGDHCPCHQCTQTINTSNPEGGWGLELGMSSLRVVVVALWHGKWPVTSQLIDDTKDTCGSCSGFYASWLWTRQNLAPPFLSPFGCETNKTIGAQREPNHKKTWPTLQEKKWYLISDLPWDLCLGMNFLWTLPACCARALSKRLLQSHDLAARHWDFLMTCFFPSWIHHSTVGMAVNNVDQRHSSWSRFMCLVFWWTFSNPYHNIP